MLRHTDKICHIWVHSLARKFVKIQTPHKRYATSSIVSHLLSQKTEELPMIFHVVKSSTTKCAF